MTLDFGYVLVAARLLALSVWLPGFGFSLIPLRVRLGLACMVSLACTPSLAPHLPVFSLPTLVTELFFGSVLGAVAYSVIVLVETVGDVASQEMTFSNVFNQTLDQRSTALGSLWTYLFAVVFWLGEGYSLVIHSFMESYTWFPMTTEQANTWIFQTFARGFRTALELSSPFWVVGMVIHVVMGLLNRLVSHVPVFFLSQPIHILAGIGLVISVTPAIVRAALSLISSILGFR